MKMIKVVLQIHELKEIRHLLALVEGIIVISRQNMLCDEDIMLEFRKEKNKLIRLIVAAETGLAKYISQKQILALARIIKIGKKLLPPLYKEKLVASTYVNDFLTLSDVLQNLDKRPLIANQTI